MLFRRRARFSFDDFIAAAERCRESQRSRPEESAERSH
jgi:hypothetical protein